MLVGKKNSRTLESELYAFGQWIIEGVSFAILQWVARKSWGRLNPRLRAKVLFAASSILLTAALLSPVFVGVVYLGVLGSVVGLVPLFLAMILKGRYRGRFRLSYLTIAFQLLLDRFITDEVIGYKPVLPVTHTKRSIQRV